MEHDFQSVTNFLLLVILILSALNLRATNRNTKQQRINMATLQERFDELERDLDEAASEILALIEELRALGMTPESEAVLARLEAKAQALADVVPTA